MTDPGAPRPPQVPEPAGPGTEHQPSERLPRSGFDERGRVRRGRVSRLWTSLIIATVVLVALIIFIAQNSASVTVHFLGLDGRISLALALLLSAVAGILLAATLGTIRIVQLRQALKRNTPDPLSSRKQAG